MRNRYNIHIEGSEKIRVMGVYVFFLGDKFYIGRSICVRSRIFSHARRLNKCIINYSKFKNGLLKRDRDTSIMYLRMAEYMHEHPKISGIRVDRVFICPDHISLCAKEKQLLRLYENHPDCFNSSFHCSVIDKQITSKLFNKRAKYSKPDNGKTDQKPRPTKAELLKILQKIRKK